MDNFEIKSTDIFLNIRRNCYSQGLQIVRCFDYFPGTFRTAAFLSIVFLQTQDESKLSIETLQQWLHEEISGFIDSNPRDIPDQTDKILAVATYLNILYRTRVDTYLPKNRLQEYISYAHNQSWFNDPFIAFYCYALSNEIEQCSNTKDFLVSIFPQLLDKKNIASICQAIIIAKDRLTSTMLEEGYDVLLNEFEGTSKTLGNTAWLLWAIVDQKSVNNMISTSDLVNLIDTKLESIFSELFRETYLFHYLAYAWYKNNDKIFVDENSDPIIRGRLPSLSEIGISLVALRTSGHHLLYGLTKDRKDMILDLAEKGEIIKEGGSILTKRDVFTENILILIATLILGISIMLLLWGSIDITFDTNNFKQVDFWGFVLIFFDYVIGIIQAIFSGKSAAKSLFQLPLLRHFIKANKDTG